MEQIQIQASSYGKPGQVVAVKDGHIVWAGDIEAIPDAGAFDSLFCHVDDEGTLLALARNGDFPDLFFLLDLKRDWPANS